MASRRRGCGSTLLRSLGIVTFFAVLFAAGLGFFLHRALTTPFRGFAEESVLVEVRKGWNSSRILGELRREGVLRDDFFPLLYLKVLRRGASLKAGVYEFRGASTPLQVIDKLDRGDVIFRNVVIREGIDRYTIGEIMSESGFGTIDQWNEVTADAELIRDLDPEASTLEGYLFPDTYRLTPGTSPEAIARLMVQNFRKNFGDRLAYISTGLPVHQTVTLASIVETEAKLAEERPVIASVYLNRIRRGMLLQADPTVIYAMKLEGRWDGNIRKEDLQAESPYNTYRTRGLPPGPIANPGLASLEAAANPASTDFLYFVSRNDGSHVFSRTLAEHNRNVQEYQRDFFRRQRQEQAPGGKTAPPSPAPSAPAPSN